ncbi:MAG: glycosyltransferase family 4 protein [Actinobacteria bacterium]|nr:glycosyltransferase family 4 protein [Actinomycetota bacterium]
MKITVVEPRETGGMAHYAHQLCNGLAAAGAEVTLVTGPEFELIDYPRDYMLSRSWRPATRQRAGAGNGTVGGPLGKVQRMAGKATRKAGAFGRLISEWRRQVDELAADDPDWVMFGSIEFFLEAPFLAKLRRKGPRLASIVHEPNARDSGRGLFSALDRRLYHRVFRPFDALFVHNQANREVMHTLYPEIESSRLHAIDIGNIMPMPPSGPADVDLRARYGIPADAPVLLFFGNMLPSKGIGDIIDAFPAVVARYPEARLVVVGHAGKRVDPDAYARRARELGVGDRVTIAPGYVEMDEIQPHMEMATAVVLPYRSATQSGTLQVAYTFGRPVVVTNVGGLPEVVEDGESGYVVPAQDPGALGAAVIKLLEDPEHTRRMGETAKRLSDTRHSWPTVAGAILRVLDATQDPAGQTEQLPAEVGS